MNAAAAAAAAHNNNIRYERLFWEVQLRQVDDMARQLVSMRSVFERRMRRADGAARVNRPLARNLMREFGAAAGPAAPPASRRPVHVVPVVRLRAPKKKIKVLKLSDLNKVLEDRCSICHEMHQQKECVKTQCGHEFGTVCFEEWIETKKRSGQAATCPLCLAPTTDLIGYRARAKRTTRVAAAAPVLAAAAAVVEDISDESDSDSDSDSDGDDSMVVVL
jgi:hypothetical protein